MKNSLSIIAFGLAFCCASNGATAQISVTTQARQTGTDNHVTVKQSASGMAGPIIQQTGSGNAISINQGDANFSGVYVQQNGASNSASVVQNNTRFKHESTILQTGSSNQATTSESGTLNGTRIEQNGSNNAATVSQSFSSSESIITQTGSDNRATVTQTPPPTGFNTPNTSYTQIGNGVTPSVMQIGTVSHSGIYQH